MRKNQRRLVVLMRTRVHLLIVTVLLVFSLYTLTVLKSLHGLGVEQREYVEATITTGDELPILDNTKSTTSRTVTQAYKRVTKSMSELPKLPTINQHMLFFNSIPHTGSEMLILLLQWLQGWNGFRHVRLKNKAKRSYTWVQQEDLINEVVEIMKSKAVPLSFEQRYMYFINFTSFGYQSPTFINIVRDPFDKFLIRFKHELNISQNSTKIEKLRNLSEIIEKCLQSRELSCSYGNGILFDLTIPYFCGQLADCTLINNKWALAQAKLNVEKYFPVVGILEETNSTLEVLEHVLPFFFKGVQDKYYKQMLLKNKSILLKKQKKRDASDNVRKYFKQRFTLEYEFYYWLRTRLFNQLQMFSSHSH